VSETQTGDKEVPAEMRTEESASKVALYWILRRARDIYPRHPGDADSWGIAGTIVAQGFKSKDEVETLTRRAWVEGRNDVAATIRDAKWKSPAAIEILIAEAVQADREARKK